MKNVVVVGAVPLATGSRATGLALGDGEPLIIGAEGVPPIITSLPATTLHPGAYRAPKTYTGPGERQRQRILRQQERQRNKKPQGGA